MSGKRQRAKCRACGKLSPLPGNDFCAACNHRLKVIDAKQSRDTAIAAAAERRR